jgi:DNA helicase-2/ATP-dependent DNA helicase PcrA
MIDFANELNQEQLEVVQKGDGPCLVLAGAGSGKTRVITYRVAYLLEQGVNPQNILLVTFTNKAAEEMKKRVQNLANIDVGASGRLPAGRQGSPLPWAGTFHHIAYRILILYAPLLGYKPKFSILDSDDSESLLKLCIKEVKSSDDKKFPSAGVINSLISYSRNAQLPLDDVIEMKNPVWVNFASEIKTIADRYTVKKKEANGMDFDDLLVNFLLLLNNDQIRAKYAEQFKYILVDEYQDTNKIQASIIQKLSSIHFNILVVGDDAQSIYSFRAADIQNILHFDNHYPATKIFKLITNYRSTKEILDVANNVIANNKEQFKKELRPFNKTGAEPTLQPLVDSSAEAQFVVKKIQEQLDNDVAPNEIAVLFRASHHSQILEMELVKAGIPYDYRGGVRFFERAHVKDVLSYLRILNNLADTAAWLRVLMHEDGIGPAGAQKIIELIRQTENPEEIKNIGSQISGSKVQAGWKSFVSIWEKLLAAPKTSPYILIQAILDSSYQDYLAAEYVDSADRIDDLKQLAIFAEKYSDLDAFLAEASLQESFNVRGSQNINQTATTQTPKIVLSTIHQAKGLEWTVVFVIHLTNGSFPNERALKENNGLEEERRLFYVAITRAKEHLYLTYPMTGGHYGDFLVTPSLFLDEIKRDLLDDRSLLSVGRGQRLLNQDLNDGDITYVSEDEPSYSKPIKIKPGSFLQEIEDL